jgi:ABC-type transport system involved in multi-copper enzyme maturation permease subunit
MSTTAPTIPTTPATQPSGDTPVPATRGPLLPAVMHAEWTKLRSVRSTVWSLFATIFITVGLGALFSLAFVSRYDSLGLHDKLTFDATAHSLRGLFLAQIAIGVLGVLIMSSEYATGLIRSTFAAVPQRRTVLAAKAIVFGVVALVVCMVSVFVAFFVGQAILAQKSIGVGIGDPHVLRAVLGAGAYLTCVGLMGLALGAIIRRTAPAISSLFAVVLVLPLLAQALPSPWDTDVSKYLPSGLGAAMFRVRPDSSLLSPGWAFVIAVLWAVAFFGVAAVMITRRDA